MKRSIYITALVFCGYASHAQQRVQFTQYMFNINAVNPAYSGSRGAISSVALYRAQWVGFDGAPRMQSLNVNSPFMDDKLGMGLTILNEKIGPLKQTGIYADFAYRIKFRQGYRKKSILAMGLKGGADIFQAGYANLNVIDSGDELFQNNVSSKLLPNFGFGVYYYTPKYYCGFSTPKLVRNNLNIKSGGSKIANIGVNKLHYYLIGGMNHKITPFISFMPTTQIKVATGAPVSVDVNVNFLFYEKFVAWHHVSFGRCAGVACAF